MKVESNRISPRIQRFITSIGALLIGLSAAACVPTKDDPTGAISITVKPGDTGNCDTSPCMVSLVMPPGSGTYEVTANQVRVGNYPAGETVNLGQFDQSQAFEIVGAGVPKAYVYMPANL